MFVQNIDDGEHLEHFIYIKFWQKFNVLKNKKFAPKSNFQNKIIIWQQDAEPEKVLW